MPEPQIVRTQDIVVASTVKNDYGDLLVTDVEGNSYKVGNKREGLHVYFQNGAKVHLQWATYMNREYIANAFPSEQLVEKGAATNQAQKEKPTPEKVEKSEPSAREGYKADPAKTASIERQTALKAAVELVVADKIKIDSVISYATVFEAYINGDYQEKQDEILLKFNKLYGKEG